MKSSGGIPSDGKRTNGQDLIRNKKKMKRNMQRLGGAGARGGLSLESFAMAKTRNDNYNPSLIKKQREFYKNAKYVSKYKRSLKQQEQVKIHSTDERALEDENRTSESGYANKKRNDRKNTRSLGELYKKKREEEEKVRREREAVSQAKKEVREVAEARRKALKEKMYKKTKYGQPVMKYRIEHLLDALQGSTS